MAEFLASIFGTEKDRVNCPFYFKIGACCHGERCSRQHNRPTYSQTILLLHMYQSPAGFTKDGITFGEEAVQKHFDEFFSDLYCEMEDQYGSIEELNVCENLGDHLIGNVYCKFRKEEDAQKATDGLNNRWYNGAPIYAELSPVTDFKRLAAGSMSLQSAPGVAFVTSCTSSPSALLCPKI